MLVSGFVLRVLTTPLLINTIFTAFCSQKKLCYIQLTNCSFVVKDNMALVVLHVAKLPNRILYAYKVGHYTMIQLCIC